MDSPRERDIDTRVEHFADVVGRVGANLQADQDVFLQADLDCVPLVRAVVSPV